MGRVANPLFAEELFDRVPDIVFSVKDIQGRYVCISEACAERCGLESKAAAVGRTAHELFPRHMADRYVRQDERVFRTGRPIVDNLDLTLFNNREPGWCLTSKVPLFDASGEVLGLACLSKDIHEPGRAGLVDERFAATIDHIQAHYAERLRIDSLARRAGMSAAQFERRMRRIFQLSAGQFIMKTRIDAAAERLSEGAQAIATIALAVGFCDQSALSRQFKQVTGLSPRQYRQLVESLPGPASARRGRKR
ncbi:AraC family transcriptional regulator [Myxococcus sp. K15C18031901]|uniref:AraC family transcriptional regulator n=1 Tax=Myxococcus dinghuensis TaxID=2906761 RepID=UPI0020A7935C|nr:AraC family transcriptional regulator [Myxococcus dinghuensis]MCP3102135.1 AraC family transcriptional regulator [Myxococcus dinghuensis]